MFFKILASVGAFSFLAGGFDIASTEGCESVVFGGSARSSTYSCTYGLEPGDLSAGAASGLMIVGSVALLALLWGPAILRVRRGY